MTDSPTPAATPATPPLDPTAARQAAAFFDVDRTLIAGASALRMARPLRQHGLLTRRQQVRAALLQVGFSLRGADDQGIERLAAVAKELMAGWHQGELRAVVASELERHVHPTVYREALERIEMHRRQGQPVYAVSATNIDIVDPLAELLGLDGAVATEMEVVNGRFTGEIALACHGAGKAERLREFAERHGIDLATSSAYSDSISDEPFLRAVGRPYAVNPDRALRQLAEQEGWGILFFRTRVKAPLHHHRAARASAAFAVMMLLGGLHRRRRRSKA